MCVDNGRLKHVKRFKIVLLGGLVVSSAPMEVNVSGQLKVGEFSLICMWNRHLNRQ